jgi:hypothetical protein
LTIRQITISIDTEMSQEDFEVFILKRLKGEDTTVNSISNVFGDGDLFKSYLNVRFSEISHEN